MPRSSSAARIAAKFSAPSRSSSPISSGQRDLPFSSPCVSDASAKPPFRPLAAPAAAIALEQDHVLVRRGVDRRPEPGEAAADDGQGAARLPVERRQRLRRRRGVEPEDLLLGVGERAAQPRSQASTSAACVSGGKTG